MSIISSIKRSKLCLGILPTVFMFAVLYTEATATSNTYTSPDGALQVKLLEVPSLSEPSTALTLDVAFDIRSKGHIYWQNPGDTGLSTSLEWTLPEGFVLQAVHWPVPEIFSSEGGISYGYSGAFSLRAQIHPTPNFEGQAKIGLDLSWLLCDENCLPQEASLELDIPINTRHPTEPLAEAEPAAKPVSLKASIENDTLHLDILPNKNLKLKPEGLYFFPLVPWIKPQDPKHVNVTVNETRPLAKQETYRLALPLDLAKLEAEDYAYAELKGIKASLATHNSLSTMRLRGLLSLGTEGACEVDLPVLTSLPPMGSSSISATAPTVSKLWILSLAFIGGIILNAMPCVFPVLGLKIMSFMKDREGSRGRLRLQGLSFGLGILVSFWALAGLLLGLRSGGEALGWGFQLQSPFFVFLLIALFFVLGLNFLNVFLWGTGLMGLAAKADTQPSLLGSFWGGVLACVVAAPCSGPFMGTALGLAITQASSLSFLIFTALGVGLALPYVVFSFWPSLLSFLPKAGSWMESFKEAMAFPLFGSVLWLLWVLGQQTSLGVVIQVLWILLFTAIGCWAYGRWWMLSSKKVIRLCLFPFWIASAIFLGWKTLEPLSKHEALPSSTWTAYSEELLERLLSEGKPVFVDFTAGWCLTCQINKKNVLDSESAQKAFQAKGVALLRADWTHKDPRIARKLESFGRSGVPFNVLYTQNPKRPVWIFPTLLSRDTLVEALNTVDTPSSQP